MKIAILGFGVVGSGAYEVLKNAGYTVSRVLDIRKHPELGDVSTTDFNDIINDKEIDIVVEAIGGLEPAHTFLTKAIKAGKHVVTSNKYFVCTYYDEIHRLAKENGVTVRFSASAGGGIPWLYNLRRATRCDTITKVFGIMNGTTNYIVDAMITDSRDFDEVLREAQQLGYAEADPTADIDGLDVARKTAISATIAFGGEIEEKDVFTFSLRNIKKRDIEYIENKLSSSIRYLGCAERFGDKFAACVMPMILGNDSIFLCVKKNNNMISLVGENVGQLSFFGQGAGKYPTGTAIAQDVIDIVNGDLSLNLPCEALCADNSFDERQYYVRTVADFPSDLIERIETVDNEKYIITKYIKLSEMYKISADILKKDGECFLAGIER